MDNDSQTTLTADATSDAEAPSSTDFSGMIRSDLFPSDFPKPESWQGVSVPVSVVILTLNEEVNIVDCLASCRWCDDVHVVDSGSTDRTVELAEQCGAKVYHHPFTSFGEQRNWAIDNVTAQHEWIFHLDADERFTPDLVQEMANRLADGGDHEESDGYHIPQKLMLMGRWLKRAGGYPTYQVRLFHKQRMRFIDYGHGQREDPEARTQVFESPYIHHAFSKGVFEWIEKHNRYSTLEALQVISGYRDEWKYTDLFSFHRIKRWRAWKEFLYRVPGRPFIRMMGVLLIHGGFIECRAGWTYARLIAMYEGMISVKLKLMRNQSKPAEGNFESERRPTVNQKIFEPGQTDEMAMARVKRTVPAPKRSDHPVPPSAGSHVPQMQPEPSPWTFREKLFRAMWMLAGRPMFRMTFHNWYTIRANILRCFGAKVGKRTAIRPSANIEVPWMLHIDDDASVGDHAILYCLGPMYIGKRAIISQYAHLCAGTHDYTDHTFKLIRSPVTVGADVWVGTDAFIGPGVTVGELTVIGARSSLYKDAEASTVYVGNPAKAIKKRVLN